MMKTIAIIPARGGSKRLHHKNLLSFGGVPLLAHSILYAKANSEIIKEIYVTTDDEDIKRVALEYGASVIDRPAYLSGDNEPTLTAMQHVLQTIKHPIEDVVLLQPTNPLREKSLLKEAYEIYALADYDSLFTVSRNYHKLGRIENSKYLPYNYKVGQRSQELEPLYFENGLLYITKARTILEGEIISEKGFPFIVDHPFGSIDIDTREDFEYAEFLYLKNRK